LALEERPVCDDVDSLAEPCANEFSVDDLCLVEALCGEVAVSADRVNDIIKVEDGGRSAGCSKAAVERARDRALARGDRPDDDDEVGHLPTLVQERDPVVSRG